jgi:hypothetical protein
MTTPATSSSRSHLIAITKVIVLCYDDRKSRYGGRMALEREPTLDDLLNEPIVRKIMIVDGYTADDIRYLMRQAGARKPFLKTPKPSQRDRARQQLLHPAITTSSAVGGPYA